MRSHAARVLTVAIGVMLAHAGPSMAMTPPDRMEAPPPASRDLFEGDWEGSIGASKIQFRFKRESDGLVGWFVSRKNGQSYPLKDVRAKGRTLFFTYTSKPELRYELTAQKDDQTLSGISTRPDGEATPRSLVRMQGQ